MKRWREVSWGVVGPGLRCLTSFQAGELEVLLAGLEREEGGTTGRDLAGPWELAGAFGGAWGFGVGMRPWIAAAAALLGGRRGVWEILLFRGCPTGAFPLDWAVGCRVGLRPGGGRMEGRAATLACA